MNFGSFFRNLSTEQSENSAPTGGNKDGDGFSGSSLFSAPSKLLGSVTAKTGSLVSDLSHKVDLGSRIDSFKRKTAIDKVLGSAFSNSPAPTSQEPLKPQEPLQQQFHAAKLEQWVSFDAQPAQHAEMHLETELSKCSLADKPIIEESRPVEQPHKFVEPDESPFNNDHEHGVSFDDYSFGSSSDKKVNTQLKRQSTTPANRPPRPPPPRSSSQSIDEGITSLDNICTPPRPLSPPTQQEQSVDLPVSQKSSTGEIGYLTRLQCQEIVSAVDTMINDAIQDEPDYPTSQSSFDQQTSPFESGYDYAEISETQEPQQSGQQEQEPESPVRKYFYSDESGASSASDAYAPKGDQESTEEPPPTTSGEFAENIVDIDPETQELEQFMTEYMQGLANGEYVYKDSAY